MKSYFYLLLVCLLLAGCSSHQGTTAGTAKKTGHAKLTIRADKVQGLAPLNVLFHAKLSGVKADDEAYYCLEEQWDFGDGAVSAEQPHCDPYGPDAQVRTEFMVEHQYWQMGTYTVRFSLGNEKLFSNAVDIRVLSTDLEHQEPGK